MSNVTNARVKKSSGPKAAAGVFCPHRVRLNSLPYLFIQQLWITIGKILGKFTSFYGTRWRLAQAAYKAANGLMSVGNEVTAAGMAAGEFEHAAFHEAN